MYQMQCYEHNEIYTSGEHLCNILPSHGHHIQVMLDIFLLARSLIRLSMCRMVATKGFTVTEICKHL